MSTECKGLLGKMLGHKFSPVIELGQPTLTRLNIGECSEHFLETMFEKSRPQRYVGALCSRCGVLLKETR